MDKGIDPRKEFLAELEFDYIIGWYVKCTHQDHEEKRYNFARTLIIMEQKPMRISKKQAGNFAWKSLPKGTFLACVALVLSLVLINDVRFLLTDPKMMGWQHFVLIFGCTGFLAWCLERFFYLARLDRKFHYRLAFWIAAASPLLYLLLVVAYDFWLGDASSLLRLHPLKIGLIGMVSFMGSYLGCMLATTIADGLWENNSPPQSTIRQEVYQIHLASLGKLSAMPLWKRIFDTCLASVGLMFSLPIWFLGTFLIWYEDPGPLFFVKNSVGRYGKNFHQLKLRTMIRGAEEQTGPVISQRDDRRILITGKFFRKTALDELPQLLNIIRGEMSFVGPRPQRTVLVHQYLQSIPEYAERHKVLPGLSGLAQVAGDYYLTPRQKLRLDRLYIRDMSLGFDLKLLFLAFLITFWFRWQKDWNGRLPRSLIRYRG